jgi:hypothetical protein
MHPKDGARQVSTLSDSPVTGSRELPARGSFTGTGPRIRDDATGPLTVCLTSRVRSTGATLWRPLRFVPHDALPCQRLPQGCRAAARAVRSTPCSKLAYVTPTTGLPMLSLGHDDCAQPLALPACQGRARKPTHHRLSDVPGSKEAGRRLQIIHACLQCGRLRALDADQESPTKRVSSRSHTGRSTARVSGVARSSIIFRPSCPQPGRPVCVTDS